MDEIQRLYDQLQSPQDLGSTFVTTRAGETNHIEFKGKRDCRTPDLADDDKKNFSMALSSFSNADGGILVWGIETRKKNGRDYAAKLNKINNVDEFAERLRSSLLDSTIPRNHKVAIKTLKNRQGNGFAICLIPAAEDVPVRAMKAEREYWVRMDGRSMRLEHYQIRDMMLRHAHPDLVFSIKADITAGSVKILCAFKNTGKAIAKYWGWFIEMDSVYVLSANQCRNESSNNPGRTCIARDGGLNDVIHPNNILHNVGVFVLDSTQLPPRVAIRAIWYCEDMSVKEKTFTLEIPAAAAPSTTRLET